MLPMDLWAHVASFLPFDELLPTFWSLRKAGLLPATYTTPSQSFLQFCALVSQEEEEESYQLDVHLHKTLCEWFDPSIVDYSIRLCRGHPDAVLEHLMHMLSA